ncbi:hypothetical protein Q3G72_007078 [Acer saccharum]|nr:hypothetical protein Q3G72_007078 [Acer saccharum]
MEKRGGVESVLMVFVILGLVVGQSAASFQTCYAFCFIPCMISERNLLECGTKCLKKCIFPSSSSHTLKHTDYFCKLGCATSLCTHLSTKEDPGSLEEKEGTEEGWFRDWNRGGMTEFRGQDGYQPRHSFTEVVEGKTYRNGREIAEKPEKVRTIYWKGQKANGEWLSKCVVGVLTKFSSVCSVNNRLNAMDFSFSPIYLGDKSIL